MVAGQYALDIGTLSNNLAVCPLDYFNAATRAELEPKLGRYDGTIRRTDPPVCGEVNQDLAGTLRGIWLKQGLPKYPEDNHITFVKDNVEPAKPCISIGGAVPAASIIVKLDNSTTLSFEKRNCDCATNLPYSFTTSKMVFVRQ